MGRTLDSRVLYKPIDNSTPGQRLADILGGTETAAFTALSFGDIVYDRVSIDPNVLTAFDFRKPPTEAGIYNLATLSRHIESEPLLSHAGHIRAVSIGIELGFPRGAKRRSVGGRFSFWDALRRRIGQFVRRLSTEVAPNSSLMQDILQHDRNPL